MRSHKIEVNSNTGPEKKTNILKTLYKKLGFVWLQR